MPPGVAEGVAARERQTLPRAGDHPHDVRRRPDRAGDHEQQPEPGHERRQRALLAARRERPGGEEAADQRSAPARRRASTKAPRWARASPGLTGKRPDSAATGLSRDMLHAGSSAATTAVTIPSSADHHERGYVDLGAVHRPVPSSRSHSGTPSRKATTPSATPTTEETAPSTSPWASSTRRRSGPAPPLAASRPEVADLAAGGDGEGGADQQHDLQHPDEHHQGADHEVLEVGRLGPTLGAARLPRARVQHVVARAERDPRGGQRGLQLLELAARQATAARPGSAGGAGRWRRQPAVERSDEGQRRAVAVGAVDDARPPRAARRRRPRGRRRRPARRRGQQPELVGRGRGDRDLVGRARRPARGQLGPAGEERVVQVGELDEGASRRWAGATSRWQRERRDRGARRQQGGRARPTPASRRCAGPPVSEVFSHSASRRSSRVHDDTTAIPSA